MAGRILRPELTRTLVLRLGQTTELLATKHANGRPAALALSRERLNWRERTNLPEMS